MNSGNQQKDGQAKRQSGSQASTISTPTHSTTTPAPNHPPEVLQAKREIEAFLKGAGTVSISPDGRLSLTLTADKEEARKELLRDLQSSNRFSLSDKLKNLRLEKVSSNSDSATVIVSPNVQGLQYEDGAGRFRLKPKASQDQK